MRDSGHRRSRSGIATLAVAYGLGAGVSFILNVILGRTLGAAALGTFALANSVSRIFYSGTDLGISPHLTRAVARDRAVAQPLASLFGSFRLALIPVAIIVSLIAATLLDDSEITVFCAVAVAQGLLSMQVLYEALVQAHERPANAAVLNVIASVCLLMGFGVWLAMFQGLIAFVGTYVCALAIGVTCWAQWTRTRLQIAPRWNFEPRELGRQVARSWPIGLSFLLSSAALRSPVLVLGIFRGSADVGAFAAVDMFVTAAAIFQSAVTNATFPRLAATYRNDPPAFRSAFWRSNALLAVTGSAIGVLLALFGGPVISAIFPGKDFSAIATLMPIIGWSTPILLLVHHNIFIFAAADNERLNLRFMTMWFVIIALCQFALVPSLGLVGAAWGLLLGRIIGLGVMTAVVFLARIHRGGGT